MLVVEFVGLRSKMDSYMKDNKKGGKTAKGIKKMLLKIILKMKIIRKCYSTVNKYITQ